MTTSAVRSSGMHQLRPATGRRTPDWSPCSRTASASSRVTVRVLIANHQPIVRHGLRAVIASEPDLHVSARRTMAARRCAWLGSFVRTSS